MSRTTHRRSAGTSAEENRFWEEEAVFSSYASMLKN